MNQSNMYFNQINPNQNGMSDMQPQMQPAPSQPVMNMNQQVAPVQQNVVQPVNKASMIQQYGETLTDKTFVTDPAIARDVEIRNMILALITPDKSALLVGKPGIGKTALVEGLAYRIHNKMVPEVLFDYKIVKINLPALLGKTTIDGVEVSKLQLLIDELDNVDKTILFIDEIHLLVAHNNGYVELDFANMLKPYLDRGRILMIGATTSEEYEQYVLRDRAFVRRFIKIDIPESQGQDVVKIIMGTVPKFEKKLGLTVNLSEFQQEQVYTWLVDNTSEYKRVYETQSRYPDICLTIMSSAFSLALFDNSQYVTLKHIYKAMARSSSIYDDSKNKALAEFKEKFASMMEKFGITEYDLDN